LSPYLAYILEWNRWANDRGEHDSNKPLDLKIEQINKIIKMILRRLGPNIGEETIRKLCMVAPYLHEIRLALREHLGFSASSSAPVAPERASDVSKLAAHLEKAKIFTPTPNRTLKGFKTIPQIWFSAVDREKFQTWVTKTKGKFSRARTFQPETPNETAPANNPEAGGVREVDRDSEDDYDEEEEEEEENEHDDNADELDGYYLYEIDVDVNVFFGNE